MYVRLSVKLLLQILASRVLHVHDAAPHLQRQDAAGDVAEPMLAGVVRSFPASDAAGGNRCPEQSSSIDPRMTDQFAGSQSRQSQWSKKATHEGLEVSGIS